MQLKCTSLHFDHTQGPTGLEPVLQEDNNQSSIFPVYTYQKKNYNIFYNTDVLYKY